MDEKTLVKQLNADDKKDRLEAIRGLRKLMDGGQIPEPVRGNDTNNHVHTTYSFSAYSPTAAVYKAYISGLITVGIVDHDSISGAREFIEAGEIMGITTTIGCEVRTSFTGTVLEGKVLNSPDEGNVAYIALHGVPHNKIDELDELLSRIRDLRNERNREQVKKLNEILQPYSVALDFDRDVLPISMARDGGSVTERHILFALTQKLIDKYGRGGKLIDFLQNDMRLVLADKVKDMLLDTAFEHYDYDVLNVLKSDLVPRFFIQGGADSLPVKEVVDYARKIGAIPTYCYLGDVGESPTGDKKAQKFEDDILDEVFTLVKELGFEAIAYMPSRNTTAQLQRVMDKCKESGFIEISGEDINQPRQSFVCEKLREPMFAGLVDSTWALVGHEHATEKDPAACIYSEETKRAYPVMADRIAHYRDLGLEYKK